MSFSCKCFIACIAAASTFTHDDKFKTEWQARYDGLSKVVRSQNFAKFQTYVADSYTWLTPDGKTKNRKDSLAEFKPLFEMKKVTGGEMVVNVSKIGKEFRITYDARWVLISKDNKTSHYHEVGVDTWKQFAGAWKVVHSVDKISEMK